MPDRNLTFLSLTLSERILVVSFSYIYFAPRIFAHGKRIITFLLGTSQEARRQLADEERVRRRVERRERAERVLEAYQEQLRREREAADAQAAEIQALYD